MPHLFWFILSLALYVKSERSIATLQRFPEYVNILYKWHVHVCMYNIHDSMHSSLNNQSSSHSESLSMLLLYIVTLTQV